MSIESSTLNETNEISPLPFCDPQQGGLERKSVARKSKRRSSFVNGRISKINVSKHESICENIPQNLPEDERLEMLHRYAMQCALEKTQSECSQFTGFDSLKVKITETVDKKVVELREQEAFKRLTTVKSPLKSNSEVLHIEKLTQVTEEAISRFEQEYKDWNRIQEEFKKLTEDHESEQLTNGIVECSNTSIPPVGLTTEQKALLNDGSYYTNLLEELQTLKQKHLFYINVIKRHVKWKEMLRHDAKELVQKASQHIATVSFPHLNEVDPKKLIENVTNFCPKDS